MSRFPTRRLYVNGVRVASRLLDQQIYYDQSYPWSIGSNSSEYVNSGLARTWVGLIDEVSIYNRALTLNEIQSQTRRVLGSGLTIASSNNVIHGLNIQGFSDNGVLVIGDGNKFTGNYLGTDPRGTTAFPNGYGVTIVGSNNTAGGIPGGEANVISGNALDGGPNHLQNFPELRTVSAGPRTQVDGYFFSTPNQSFTLDFYANTRLDDSGYGEGERFLGSATATTDTQGRIATINGTPVSVAGEFHVNLDAATTVTEFIVATATNELAGTSEFSGGISAIGQGNIITGGPLDDIIELHDRESNGQRFIAVTVNGIDLDSYPFDVPIYVLGLAGNDVIIIDGSIPNVTVDGGTGSDRVTVRGDLLPALQIEQLEGQRTILTTSSSQLGSSSVESLVLPDHQDRVAFVSPNTTLSLAGVNQRQVFTAPDRPTVEVEVDSVHSVLDLVLAGNSGLQACRTVFSRTTLTSASPQPEPPVSPDNLVIGCRSAGPQPPEPPSSPIEIWGYGPEDSLVFEAPIIDEVPLATTFVGTFDTSQAQIRIPTLWSSAMLFTVDMPSGALSPKLVLAGHQGLSNSGLVSIPGVVEPPRSINWRVETRNVAHLDLAGGVLDDMVSLSPESGGGLVGVIMPVEQPGAAPFEVYLNTDAAVNSVSVSGGEGVDTFDVRYPEPDFHPVAIDLHAVESVGVTPDPAAILIGLLMPVRQMLTPSAGEISTGNLVVRHDQALSSSLMEGSTLEVLVTRDTASNTFRRDLSLGFRYTGSPLDLHPL